MRAWLWSGTDFSGRTTPLFRAQFVLFSEPSPRSRVYENRSCFIRALGCPRFDPMSRHFFPRPGKIFHPHGPFRRKEGPGNPPEGGTDLVSEAPRDPVLGLTRAFQPEVPIDHSLPSPLRGAPDVLISGNPPGLALLGPPPDHHFFELKSGFNTASRRGRRTGKNGQRKKMEFRDQKNENDAVNK